MLRLEACATTPRLTSHKITSLIGLGLTLMAALENGCLFKGPRSIRILKKSGIEFHCMHFWAQLGHTILFFPLQKLSSCCAKDPEAAISLLISDISAK